MASRYKLKLKQLDFVSLVDDPAQPNAKCLLIKRKGDGLDVKATQAQLVKTSDELGLAFFWAFTSTNPDGTDHYDLHGDAVQADNDMIRAAAEFMEKGGAVDEMHDSDATGRVVFAMPMTPEIAKAFGVETKTSGLMVAIRPSTDAMAKLKSGEYRAVSIAGLGERVEARKLKGYAPGERVTVAAEKAHMPEATGPGTVVEVSGNALGIVFDAQPGMVHRWYTLDEVSPLAGQDSTMKHAGRVEKASLYTNEVDGHQHKIDVCEDGSMWVSYATSEGADNGHSHGVVFEGGQLTILADSGHTHELAEGQAGVAVVPEGAIVVVSASASPTRNRSSATQATAKSTRSAAMPHGGFTTEGIMADNKPTIIVLTEAQHAHLSKLSGSDADAFLAKSSADRDAIVEKARAADPVVYKTASGVELRKSHGDVALMLAKQADESAAQIAKANDELAKARESQQAEIYKGRVRTEIAHLAKGDDVKVAVLKAIDGIADEKLRGEALEMLKGADAIMKDAGKAKGINPGSDPQPDNAIEKFNLKLADFAKAAGKTSVQAFEAFCNTPEGSALYAASRPGQA